LSLLLAGLIVVAITPSSSGTGADGDATVVVVRADQATVVRFEAPAALPIVAPVGHHGLALTTMSAVGRATTHDTVAVQLPTGQVIEVVVVSVDEASGLAVVELPEGVTTETFAVAAAEPDTLGPDDTVMVHGDQPEVMSVAALRSAAVDEGTPVSDGEGNLLGVCTVDEDRTTLMATDADAVATDATPTTTPSTDVAPTGTPPAETDESVTPAAATAAATTGTG
jgi:hypothetical protein